MQLLKKRENEKINFFFAAIIMAISAGMAAFADLETGKGESLGEMIASGEYNRQKSGLSDLDLFLKYEKFQN